MKKILKDRCPYCGTPLPARFLKTWIEEHATELCLLIFILLIIIWGLIQGPVSKEEFTEFIMESPF